MGLDFIRTNKDRPWQKGWTAGFDFLKQPTLFDPQFTGDTRSIVIDRIPGTQCEVGSSLILRLQPDDSLVAAFGHCEVGRAVPTAAVLEAIKASAGLALGSVTKLGSLGDTAEVSIP